MVFLKGTACYGRLKESRHNHKTHGHSSTMQTDRPDLLGKRIEPPRRPSSISRPVRSVRQPQAARDASESLPQPPQKRPSQPATQPAKKELNRGPPATVQEAVQRKTQQLSHGSGTTARHCIHELDVLMDQLRDMLPQDDAAASPGRGQRDPVEAKDFWDDVRARLWIDDEEVEGTGAERAEAEQRRGQ